MENFLSDSSEYQKYLFEKHKHFFNKKSIREENLEKMSVLLKEVSDKLKYFEENELEEDFLTEYQLNAFYDIQTKLDDLLHEVVN